MAEDRAKPLNAQERSMVHTPPVSCSRRSIGIFGKLFIDGLFWTCRLRSIGFSEVKSHIASRRFIFAFWHSRILMVSYGSGSGSDSFDLTVTDKLSEVRQNAPTTEAYIARRKEINYATYTRYRDKLKMS